jgi:simple sugar transport system permease protein
VWNLLVISLAAAAVFAIAALGELIEQRAGILNVGLEGVMLLSGTFGFMAAKSSGSYVLGFAAAVLCGAVVGLLHGVFSITLGSNQVVNGMAIWILGFGLTTYIGYPFTGPLGLPPLPRVFGLPPFFLLVLVLAAASWFLLYKTHLGLKLRSVGENPSVAEASGISVVGLRYLSVLLAGVLVGLAGAVYSLVYNPVWSYNYLQGWGFIALALVFFSLWNPFLVVAGAVLFGLLWQMSLYPELLFPGLVSRYIWRTLPFVITIVVFVALSTRWFSLRWGATKPAALGVPYVREG